MRKLCCLVLLGALLGRSAWAQELDLPRVAVQDEAALALAIPALARQAMAVYVEPDRGRHLSALFRLQAVAGQDAQAQRTLQDLKEVWRSTGAASALVVLPFEMVLRAKARQAATGLALDEAFKQEFREVFSSFDDRTANQAQHWFGGNVGRARDELRAAVELQKGKDKISLPDALSLIRRYHFHRDLQFFRPLSDALIAEDDARRYIADKDILIKTPDGAQLAAMVVRPRSASAALPALLTFTIYAGGDGYEAAARKAAAHGYVGVVAFTRGKAHSPDAPVPYEHDGADAHAVIDWISKQRWSDGRVGMYGGSYDGFTQWAAAKHRHPALKTIVPYVANNPGQGLPRENGVFLFVNYAWAFYVTNNKHLDNETYFDRERWNSLNERWYQSGQSYRQIDSLDGTPNRWLQRWLQHPGYDRYWQALAPHQEEFAKIDLPVLSISGYYGDSSCLHYWKEHHKYNRHADHHLLIGPYDHFGAQAARKATSLRGYTIDPVAQIDTSEVMLQWMDHVLRGGRKPDLLKDRVNYQVMGANEWKHAPSLERMGNELLTLYLTDNKAGGRHQLSAAKPPRPGSLHQVVDLADRASANNAGYYPHPIVGQKVDFSSGFAFVSEPFEQVVEVSGAFLGEIKATINKRDMDIGIVLYELMPSGELFHLSYYVGRASYAQDAGVRRLLTPGKVESIPFDRTRLVSRRLSVGSRLLVTLNVNKHAYAQINYGTGKDVSDEDSADAAVPLKVEWHNDSHVRVPIWRRHE